LKQIDEKWFGRTIKRIGRYLTYAGYAAAAAILLIGGLAGWNRTREYPAEGRGIVAATLPSGQRPDARDCG
jgi:hypothetical protein